MEGLEEILEVNSEPNDVWEEEELEEAEEFSDEWETDDLGETVEESLESNDVWEYQLRENGAVITAYHGTGVRAVVPGKVEDASVTEIGNGVFENNTQLETVRLPSALKRIGNNAFRGCAALTRVKITRKVEAIGAGAFANCEKLTKIEFRGNAPEIGGNAFENVTAFAYHTFGKESWTEEKCANYGGNITWRAYPVLEVKNKASNGKPKLSWTPIEGAVAYKVYRATEKKGPYHRIKTTENTSLINVSAKPGESFFYKDCAVMADETEDTARSSAQQRTCDLPRPEVSITRSPKGNPKLTWEEVPGAVEYNIYRATSEKGNYTRIKVTDEDTYVDSRAQKGKTNYYKVVAVAARSAADSAYSKVVSLKLK